jgi:hypothetical protein
VKANHLLRLYLDHKSVTWPKNTKHYIISNLPRRVPLNDLVGYDANVFHQEETRIHKYLLDLSLCLSNVDKSILSLKQIGTNTKHHTASTFSYIHWFSIKVSIPKRQSSINVCHFAMCLLHVSAFTWPSSGRSITKEYHHHHHVHTGELGVLPVP